MTRKKGWKISNAHKEAIIKYNKGKKLSEYTKNKIKEKRKLQIITDESKKKRSETLIKGYKEEKYKIINRGGWNKGINNQKEKECKNCIVKFKSNSKIFCSKKCYNKYKINKPCHSQEWKVHLSKRWSKENNPSWKGGISFEPYPVSWNNKLKKSIKERDKNKCLLCKSVKKLCVHHINYNKKDCNPENLITLCQSCHSKTNYNREMWLLLFKVPDNTRKYILSLAMLADRLSIVTLKSIKISNNKKEYEKEAHEIMHDLDLVAKDNNIKIKEFGQLIRAIQVNMLINEMIWSNESKARKGEEQDLILLKLTHSLNRIRNQAMNVISNIIGERKDLKLDYMDAELTKQFGYDFSGIFDEN